MRAPRSRIRRVFTGLACAGRKIVTGRFSRRPAQATAAPWLPVLAAITGPLPLRSTCFESAYTAPRTLKEPVGSSDSIFRNTARLIASSEIARTSGVGSKCFARSACASCIACHGNGKRGGSLDSIQTDPERVPIPERAIACNGDGPVEQHWHGAFRESTVRPQRSTERRQVVIGGPGTQNRVAVRTDHHVADPIRREVEPPAGPRTGQHHPGAG